MGRSGYGPDERHLLEGPASALYERAVLAGSLAPGDVDLADGSPDRSAVDLLTDIGLLRRDDSSGALFAVDPSTIQSQVVVPLGRQGAELLSESARWADAFGGLSQVFRTSPQATFSPVTEIHGMENINSFINSAVNDCRHELLTAQPSGRRRATTLATAEERDLGALERGVQMRTLYQHPARHSPATRTYVADMVARGAEVRTLDEFFKRLIVVDRKLAIIPGPRGDEMALVVNDRSLIAYLVDIFERSWERAQPFNFSGGRVERHIAADMRAMTIRLLVEGHSDPASAKRLGVSTRTYAGYIAALKDEYGVQTRFQLGYAMGQERDHHSAAIEGLVGSLADAEHAD